MEDFKRRLFKEYLELSLKTNKNLCFIKCNHKFKELSWGEQCLQWRQYFAQKDYMEALEGRIYLLTTEEERKNVYEILAKRFLNIYQGGAITLYVDKSKAKEFTRIENICDGEIAANGQMTGLCPNMCALYAMIVDAGQYDDGNEKYVVHEAKDKKPNTSDPFSREMQDARD